jgi:hypothetical protein
MAGKPKSIGPQGKALYIDGIYQAKRVDSFSSTNELNEEKILELANSEVAEKVNTLTVSASVTFHDYGSIAPFMQAVGQGTWQNEANPARILTDKAIENGVVDIMAHMSDDEIDIDFAEWNGYLFLTSFSWDWPADGFASETYDYEGENSRFFLNDWKNASVYKADLPLPYTIAGSTVEISGANLQSTHHPILMQVNEEVVATLSESGHTITFTDSGGDTEVTATGYNGAVTFQPGDRVRIVTSGSSSTFSALASTPAGLGALRRGHIVPKLYNPAGNAENTLRIQGISVDADLGRDELVQLGSKKAYFREIKRPLNISITVDINETDLEEFAKLAGQETAFDAATLREINPDNYLKNNTLEVLFYKDEIVHSFANELKRIKFTNVSVASDEDSTSSADVTGTRSITLSSENFTVSGSGVTPFL